MTPQLNLSDILASHATGATKGFPKNVRPMTLREIASQGWNLLRGDLPFPVAVLKDSALNTNIALMREFLNRTGASLCPHGKTTMCPQLFERQLADGAWGLTAATLSHVSVYRRAGVRRILFANQLFGSQDVEYIAREIRGDPGFEFFCLVDSAVQLDLLSDVLRGCDAKQPIGLLIEMGASGGRCGVRTVEDGVTLAGKIADRRDLFFLAGIEAFEGAVFRSQIPTSQAIDELLNQSVDLAERCDRENYFGGEEILLTAGGSMYFARVAAIFRKARLSRKHTILLRSGCYLTHDNGLYANAYHAESKNLPHSPRFEPSLEVWSQVQSLPEPGLAILALGKRDISFDAGLPVPLKHVRESSVQDIDMDHFEIVALNDHHAFMSYPVRRDLKVSDLIALGVSHPCTTFDRWQLIYIVNDDYTVIEAVRTFF